MRLALLTLGVLAGLCSRASAQEPVATPFWLLPKVELNFRELKPAEVALVAMPDRSRSFAMLQVGDADLTDYSARNATDEPDCRIVPGGLNIGALPYTDRAFFITQLPETLAGMTLLQTRMQHKPILDGRFGIILSTTKPCNVFVAVEQPALETYKQHGVPSWLQEFSPTGYQLSTNHPSRGTYQIFVKQAPAGRIVFGAPCLEVFANSMYFAFFAEAK